jgi:predicted RNA binding protein YcfA (HicA-like mRNA interferase family)
MKIPRDISWEDFILKLQKFGYQITRQTGSHFRLTTNQSGTHHITIPNHNALRIGTLSSILSEVADHLEIEKSELIKELFYK